MENTIIQNTSYLSCTSVLVLLLLWLLAVRTYVDNHLDKYKSWEDGRWENSKKMIGRKVKKKKGENLPAFFFLLSFHSLLLFEKNLGNGIFTKILKYKHVKLRDKEYKCMHYIYYWHYYYYYCLQFSSHFFEGMLPS